MKLRYTIVMELDDHEWGFSNLLHDGEINEIAKENILDLIYEDVSFAMDHTISQRLRLIK